MTLIGIYYSYTLLSDDAGAEVKATADGSDDTSNEMDVDMDDPSSTAALPVPCDETSPSHKTNHAGGDQTARYRVVERNDHELSTAVDTRDLLLTTKRSRDDHDDVDISKRRFFPNAETPKT